MEGGVKEEGKAENPVLSLSRMGYSFFSLIILLRSIKIPEQSSWVAKGLH